jgi:prepilin-type processing-associated H-X9-DG protein
MDIKYPAEMMGLTDASYFIVYPPNTGYISGGRHNGGLNQSYVDGHAKWLSVLNIPTSGETTPTNGNHYWYGTN